MNQPAHILIVDDEEPVRSGMRDLLQSKGHHVQTAPSGFAALECARQDAGLEVVFLDLTMPGMDGFATLKQLRKLRPELKIVMCSNVNETSTVLLAVRLGAHNYISKPFHEATLERVLDDCLVDRHSPTGHNRRNAPRLPLRFKLRHGMEKDGNMCDGLGREISIRGLGFTTERKYSLDNEIDIQFSLPNTTTAYVKTRGRVRNICGNSIGAEFLNLPLDDVLKIVDLIYTHH